MEFQLLKNSPSVLKTDSYIGQFHKTSVPYQLDSFLEFKGIRRGSLIWKSEGTGCFRSGISRRDRQECIPWKHLFYKLDQFASKAWTDNNADDRGSMHAGYKTTGKDIHRSICFHVGYTLSYRGLIATKHPLVYRENSFIKYYVHPMQNCIGLLTENGISIFG